MPWVNGFGDFVDSGAGLPVGSVFGFTIPTNSCPKAMAGYYTARPKWTKARRPMEFLVLDLAATLALLLSYLSIVVWDSGSA